MYNINEEALYGRALFSFTKDQQEINVAFEPIEGNEYLVVIFAEDGEEISNPHDQMFVDTLDAILVKFDSGRGLKYKAAAI